MRPRMLVGIALIAVGAVIMLRGFSYRSDRSVIKVGDFQASVEERRAVPGWVGGVAIAAGLALVLVGSGWRRDA